MGFGLPRSVWVDDVVLVKRASSEDAADQVINGSFEAEDSAFTSFVMNSANGLVVDYKSTDSAEGAFAALIDVADGGFNSWDVQTSTATLNLVAGERYELSFRKVDH